MNPALPGAAYNIIPVHDVLADHVALHFPEVRAAVAALQTVGELRKPPGFQWRQGMDLLDWLQGFFGFQEGNVKNQREHLILLLANSQMRVTPPPDPIDRLDQKVVVKLRKKVLKNYRLWCSFMGRPNKLKVYDGRVDERLELLYISLYFLVWGEAANLRFMPECLAFIFHNMVDELNQILEDYIDEMSAMPVRPVSHGENGYLKNVITPLYAIVKEEAAASKDGKAPHSAWRNYDDMNEYFWSNRCFQHLGWPLNLGSNYFVKPAGMLTHKVGKTGFVEQRSFWNLYRSFDRLWVMYILFLQASILITWEEAGPPWTALRQKDISLHLFSLFITWAGLRILQAVLDIWMQRRLMSRETMMFGVRMVLKVVTGVVWVIVFAVLYSQMWRQRRQDGFWSNAANQRLKMLIEAALVFIAPEVLALLLFILPWVRNFIENKDWKIFNLMTWWFQTRLFVGRGLRESLYDNIKYTLFWIMVLAAKFSFSYAFQISPLVRPTRATLRTTNVEYRWHQFFGRGNRIAAVCLWAPVVLVYFMDTQIWYSVFSSLVGALIGLFSHIGEIRSIHQFRLRFPFFASAIQFNLMPEESLLRPRLWGSWSAAFKDLMHRLKLRYGFGSPYKKIEAKQIEGRRFAHVWNQIINTFREEDLVSNSEINLLEVPTPKWNISVLQWPAFLLGNEILMALGQARDWQDTDRRLWRKICKNEFRPSAVIECYESLKHILLRKIINEESEDHATLTRLFEQIDSALSQGKFCNEYNLYELPNIHSRVLPLIAALLKRPTQEDTKEVVTALQNLFDVVVRDFPKHKGLQDYLIPRRNDQPLPFVESIILPDPEDNDFFPQLKRVHIVLSTKESISRVPHNLEARRRISFFSNSLFMTMPRAPQVEKMLSFSVLTPYYSESVLYTKNELLDENEEGVSILFYLQKIFPDEWINFLERMSSLGIKESDLWTADKGLELRLWASYRGQTLARTVRGMMYYNRALQIQAFLDSASENDLHGYREMLSRASSMADDSRNGSHVHRDSFGHGQSGSLYKEEQYRAASSLKFTYVVACQIYGNQKAKNEHQAEEILFLMQKFEALRIAYVDEVPGRDAKTFYSVLVKYDPASNQEVEIYRIQLPGPLKLGEGKPENQNHALIFTRGEAVQTIDMNQDNYFEEALKMRNLLQEFTRYYGMRKPTILGVREHVFTGSVSSLAHFMSSQESSFVTLGQRVLANPLKVRMHYGHPDVFDRLWFISRGGISKASRVINISEDIFAGFNCTLRGGNVTHHEYIQVGKGRDVGLNQIALFEAKVASGNGEQTLSRDVYRLGHRLDFFRMLSFYYTTVGFYLNNMMVVLTVYAFLWGRVYLALSGVERGLLSSSTSNSALTAALNQQFIVQLGLFTALPMIVENSIERGFSKAVWDFFTIQLQLASMFFTFSMGTKTHYFGRTLLHGGAKYRATGRGFVVKHERFAENYRLYSRSHFIKGLELALLLVVYEAYGSFSKDTVVYILLTFSSWFLALTWILAPFVFNPSGFDWLKTVDDYEDFFNWVFYRGGVLVKADQSWESWWDEEQDHLRTTGIWGKVFEVILSLRFFFFQYGIVYQLGIANHSTSILVYLLSWIYVVVAFLLHKILSFAHEKYATREHLTYRAIQAFALFFSVLVLILLIELTSFRFLDLIVSLLAFLPTGWGLLQIAQVLRRPFLERTGMWPTVVTVARLYELGIGILVMVPTAVLSWLPGFQAMQTRILFNQAFSRGLQISRILVGKRPKSY
ncbi:callose synthase 12 [Selaginella moellendorffii]|uniref:callose synthase 12 n=1 Tax=Selaginella moellendorffii TaxID=88036 RepID=UPI000D1D1087|nr:callose synthase 12 [Selaginella moellendorffii]|eukprot:XP_024538919.1 callose synthase 12 [Selaginella moellendorffii]